MFWIYLFLFIISLVIFYKYFRSILIRPPKKQIDKKINSSKIGGGIGKKSKMEYIELIFEIFLNLILKREGQLFPGFATVPSITYHVDNVIPNQANLKKNIMNFVSTLQIITQFQVVIPLQCLSD